MAFWKNRAPKSTGKDHGLFEVYKPKDGTPHTLDIVVIHGLGGSAFSTWTADNQNMWPRDCIPEVIPTARIMTFGYDSKYAFTPSKADIEDFARDLLNMIRVRRWSVEAIRKPIIFICHSLGGIVCKKALVIAQSESFFTNIIESTRAILFFGCPHRGSRVASWATTMGNFVNTCSFHRPIREELLNNLTESSRILSDISIKFKEIASSMAIKTFYETHIMSPLKGPVVEKDSAILGLPNEQLIPLAADHRNMVRFDSIKDPKFETVFYALTEVSAGGPPIDTDSISSPGYLLRELGVTVYSKQFQTVPDRTPGTCGWLSNTEAFQSWLESERSSFLILTGFPGVGKSVIAKHIVQNIIPAYWIHDSENGKYNQSRCSERDKFLAYFFCSVRNRDWHTEEVLLRSILQQLLYADNLAIESLKKFKRKSGPAFTFLHDRLELWEAISSVIIGARWTTFYLVLDALDELEQERLQPFARDLQAKLYDLGQHISPRSVKVLVTMRPDKNIEQYLRRNEGLAIEVNTHSDIENYLRMQIEAEAGSLRLSRDRQTVVFNTIVQNAGNMFLWARLAWERFRDSLKRGSDFGACFTELLSLSPRLESMFEEILSRYDGKSLSILTCLFKWISCSTRSLHIDELRFAVALNHNDSGSLSQILLAMPSQDEIREICPNIITVDQNGFVQFVHSSVKDYVMDDANNSSISIDWSRTHSELAMLCLRSLTLGGFNPQEVQSRLCQYRAGLDLSELTQQHHLLFYANSNWPEHMRAAGEQLPIWWPACRHFFMVENTLRLWLMLFLYDRTEVAKKAWRETSAYWLKDSSWSSGSTNEYGKPIVPAIHVAVYLKNTGLVKRLVQEGFDVNARLVRWSNSITKYYRPFLPEGGSVLHFPDLDTEMLNCLFSVGVDSTVKDGSGHTSFSNAMSDKNEELASRLYQQAQGKGPTKLLDQLVLYNTINSSMHKLLQDLLDNKELHLDFRNCLKEVNTPLGKFHATPLEYACLYGRESSARIMFSHQRVIDAQSAVETKLDRGPKLSLPLIVALQGWADLTLRALETRSTNAVHDRDMNRRTVLHHAVIEEWHDVFESCVKIFPQSKLGLQDKNGMSALHHAAKVRNWYAAKRLLEESVPWAIPDHLGRTPAHVAAEEGSERVLNIMIETNSVDVREEDGRKRRVLHYVAMRGFYDIAEKLIDVHKADVQAKDSDGRTVGHVAALFGATNVLSLLISNGYIDINSTDYYENSLLHYAVESGSEYCVEEILWKEGLHRNALNRYGKSALDVANNIRNENCKEYILDILREAGVRPGYWRPRQPYVQKLSYNDKEIPDKYADRDAWALVDPRIPQPEDYIARGSNIGNGPKASLTDLGII